MACLIRAAHNPDCHPPAYLYLCLNSEPSHATPCTLAGARVLCSQIAHQSSMHLQTAMQTLSIGCVRDLHGPPVPPSPVRLCLSLSRHPRHDRGQGCRGRRTGTGNRGEAIRTPRFMMDGTSYVLVCMSKLASNICRVLVASRCIKPPPSSPPPMAPASSFTHRSDPSGQPAARSASPRRPV